MLIYPSNTKQLQSVKWLLNSSHSLQTQVIIWHLIIRNHCSYQHMTDPFTFPHWWRFVFELLFTPVMIIKKKKHKKPNNPNKKKFPWSRNFYFFAATLHSAKYSDKMKTLSWKWATTTDWSDRYLKCHSEDGSISISNSSSCCEEWK